MKRLLASVFAAGLLTFAVAAPPEDKPATDTKPATEHKAAKKGTKKGASKAESKTDDAKTTAPKS